MLRGEIQPDEYNSAWWELRNSYQGITPPVERPEVPAVASANYAADTSDAGLPETVQPDELRGIEPPRAAHNQVVVVLERRLVVEL